MKKGLLLAVCWFWFGVGVKAQFAPIPDVNFRNYLTTNGFASCFNGSYLDTSATLVLNTKTIDCNSLHILSLNGIQYFKNLDTLNCSKNQLQSISELPKRLRYLDCNTNSISLLNKLPDSLTYLNCASNLLASAPALGNYLNHFDCSVNGIPSLLSLPSSLNYLSCSGNSISDLPVLPIMLRVLLCQNNQLSSMPNFPITLTTLSCSSNQLTTLPSLPNAITTLSCNDNQLAYLPDLPDSLESFYCGNNVHLNCLPTLKRIVHLNFINTGVSCLPACGQIDFSSPPLSFFSLCDTMSNNPCISTSISQSAIQNSQFEIFPNPASTQLYIQTNGIPVTEVTLYNTTGELVSHTAQPTNQGIEVSHLATGVYIAEIKTREGSFKKRWVKM